jgi:ribosomal protein L24E
MANRFKGFPPKVPCGCGGMLVRRPGKTFWYCTGCKNFYGQGRMDKSLLFAMNEHQLSFVVTYEENKL